MSTVTIVTAVGLVLLFFLLILGRMLSSVGRNQGTLDLGGDTSAPQPSKRLTVSVTRKIGEKHLYRNGVEVSDEEIKQDPALRHVLEQAEKALHDPKGSGFKRQFKINGVTYNDLSEVPDPNLRRLAEDALKQV